MDMFLQALSLTLSLQHRIFCSRGWFLPACDEEEEEEEWEAARPHARSH